MAPSSQILVYYITPEGEPVSDVADFEVQLLHKEVSLHHAVYRTRLIKTSGGSKRPESPKFGKTTSSHRYVRLRRLFRWERLADNDPVVKLRPRESGLFGVL